MEYKELLIHRENYKELCTIIRESIPHRSDIPEKIYYLAIYVKNTDIVRFLIREHYIQPGSYNRFDLRLALHMDYVDILPILCPEVSIPYEPSMMAYCVHELEDIPFAIALSVPNHYILKRNASYFVWKYDSAVHTSTNTIYTLQGVGRFPVYRKHLTVLLESYKILEIIDIPSYPIFELRGVKLCV